MEQAGFFSDVLLVLVVATAVSVLFERLGLPSLLGFLLAGVAMGPHGFGWLQDVDSIHRLSGLGVALLMLTIGLEFSFERMRGLKKVALVGGFLQLCISCCIGIAVSGFTGWSHYQGFFLGSVIALSSTAMVLKYLIDRGEVDTVHGRVAIAILIFQDLAVVPLLILLQNMGAGGSVLYSSLVVSFMKAGVLLGVVFLSARYVIPGLFHRLALSKNQETLFLSSLVLCFGLSWLSARLDLSAAIGAFFAGLLFANNDYGVQLLEDIVPFRRVFVSIFFVSIGLLFDFQFALAQWLPVLRLVGFVLFVNFVVIVVIGRLLGYPLRICLTAGILLSQVGEFAFLLIDAARGVGGIPPYLYQLLLSVTFITLFLSPLLFLAIPYLARLAGNAPIPTKAASRASANEADIAALRGHVILCGFGPVGEDIASACKEEGIAIAVIELSPHGTDRAKKRGIPVIYGDAANIQVLRNAGIERARMVVLSFAEPAASERIIALVEAAYPDVLVMVRTRFERDVARWYGMGADFVVVEEWETSFELHRVLLEQFSVSGEAIAKHLQRVRTRKEMVIEAAFLNQEQ